MRALLMTPQQNGWGWWQPWVNTIAYYPLTSTTTTSDMSWNWYNLTNNWMVFGTYHWVSCAYKGKHYKATATVTTAPTWNAARTYSFWCYNENTTIDSSDIEWYIVHGNLSTNNMVLIGASEGGSWKDFISQRGSWKQFWVSLRGQWVYNCVVYNGSTFYWYRNWTLLDTWTYTINTTWYSFIIGGNPLNWRDVLAWTFSEVILENKARTATEASDYYNNTKSSYWL